jgi:hypothetical protein
LPTNNLIKFEPTTSKLRPEKQKKKHQNTKAKNVQIKLPPVEEEPTYRTAAREGHGPSPGPPRQRSDAVKPDAAENGQKKAERSPHAHHRAESVQARGSHAPITDDRNDRILQRQGRKTPGNEAGGARGRQKAAEKCRSGFQNQEKSEKKKKTGQKKLPADNTIARPLLQRRHLDMKIPAKTKEMKKKKKTKNKPP